MSSLRESATRLPVGNRLLVPRLRHPVGHLRVAGDHGVERIPAMVGVAQMALLAPMLVLVLIGGGLADFLGGRRVALVAQTLAGVPPLLLALVIWQGQLSFAAMVVYGIAMGSLSAFLTPARDGLLNEVAPGTVQQAVQLATMVQFIGQMIGIFIAAFADSWGAVSMLTIQGTIFLLGVLGFARIPQPDVAPVRRHPSMLIELRVSIVAGYRVVADDQATRTTVLQNIAMSLFFMGAFIVTIPCSCVSTTAVTPPNWPGPTGHFPWAW